jgi:uncharacterized protein YodC (DUF2158 family)
MPINHPALEKVWEGARREHADIVEQPLPVRFLVLLCELKEKERALADSLQAGDIVRLKIGSREMIVSKVLDAGTIECTYFDGEQQFTAAVPAADVEKVGVPRDPTLPPAPD